ncbi:MAG: DUF6527 family protein [Acidobacteriota bacterium]
MKRRRKLRHEFVDLAPGNLKDGVVYVSVKYATAIHKCCCGCGSKVVTPLSPTDWQLGFDGETISLSPSIGNWALPCRSHYWIINDRVRWAENWTDERIAEGRQKDQLRKDTFYSRISNRKRK